MENVESIIVDHYLLSVRNWGSPTQATPTFTVIFWVSLTAEFLDEGS